MASRVEPIDLPATQSSPLPGLRLPVEQLLDTAGRDGGRRRLGLQAVFRALSPLGLDGVGLLLPADAADGEHGLQLDDLGARLECEGRAPGAVEAACRDFVAAAPAPGEAPALYAVGSALVVDLVIAGRRQGVCALVGALVACRPLMWPELGVPVRPVLLAVAALLRADAWRARVERLVETLAQARALPQPGPVTSPQEAVAWAADDAAAVLQAVSEVTGHPEGSLHLPDPDDGVVWDLAVLGGRRLARHAGVAEDVPPHLVHDWLAAEVMTPAAGGAAVRRVPNKAARDALVAARGLSSSAVLHPDQSGPWVLARRPLDPDWSPARRNLLLVLSGARPGASWASAPDDAPLSEDEQARLAALLERVHDRVRSSLADALERWRDTLRASVLAELEQGRGADGVAHALAAGLGAAAVSIWRVVDEELVLMGSAGLSQPDELPRFSLSHELLDPREHGLLLVPLFRPRRELSMDGFLGWSPVLDARGAPLDNVGTVPLRADGQAVGLLRVDGVQPLFGGLVAPSDAPGLRAWRPDRTPDHAREVLVDLARWLARVPLSRTGSSASATLPWGAFVAAVRSGSVSSEAVGARLADIYAEAPTRGAAADRLDVHRNTFRRHLQAIAAAVGEDVVPWD